MLSIFKTSVTAASGSIFKTEVTVFHYTDRPKPVNNLFIFSSLSNDFVYSREKNHASVTVTVVRDRKIGTALRTNQIAEFVTVTAWKKIKVSIYRLELSVWVTPQTERVIVLSKILALTKSLVLLLSVISRMRRSNKRTKPVKDRLSQQFCQSFFTCARLILEYDVLLASIKRRC